jgi:hypothetical protein
MQCAQSVNPLLRHQVAARWLRSTATMDMTERNRKREKEREWEAACFPDGAHIRYLTDECAWPWPVCRCWALQRCWNRVGCCHEIGGPGEHPSLAWVAGSRRNRNKRRKHLDLRKCDMVATPSTQVQRCGSGWSSVQMILATWYSSSDHQECAPGRPTGSLVPGEEENQRL